MTRLNAQCSKRSGQMKKKTLFAVASLLTVLGLLAAAPRAIEFAIKEARTGPLHTLQLRDQPEFLTDETALEVACSAMSLDGLDMAEWKPQEDDRTKAPDGTPDRHLVRSTFDPNRGLHSVRARRSSYRIVVIELHEGRIECQVWLPKWGRRYSVSPSTAAPVSTT